MPIIDNISTKPAQTRRKTHAMMLLDETGSMQGIREETVKGVNEYIQSLRVDKGDDVVFTLVKFDSNHYTPMYEATPIKDVKDLTLADYNPSAMTNLFDSIGRLITTADEGAADAILCIIMTDGEENYSKEYSRNDIKKLVEQKEKQDKSWAFTFLGADIDAYAASKGSGIATASTVSYNKGDTAEAFGLVTNSTENFRSANVAGQSLGSEQLYDSKAKADLENKAKNPKKD